MLIETIKLFGKNYEFDQFLVFVLFGILIVFLLGVIIKLICLLVSAIKHKILYYRVRKRVHRR